MGSFHGLLCHSDSMSFFSVIGRIMVTLRRLVGVITLLVLLVALVSPVYRVHVDVSEDEQVTYLYHFLYELETGDEANGNQVSFNTDVGYLIVLGITFVCNLLTILILTFAAIRSNRARIVSILAMGLVIFGALEFLFIPLVMPCDPYPGSTATEGQGPCNSIWGKTDDEKTEWGPYYGWYLMVVCCAGAVLHLILGVASPNPHDDDDEYVPITSYA